MQRESGRKALRGDAMTATPLETKYVGDRQLEMLELGLNKEVTDLLL